MKEMFRKNVLCILALLLMGGMSASGVTTVYNLVKAEEGITELPTWGEKVTSGGVSLNMQAYGQENFDNRIAVGPTSRNNDSGNCFKFRTAGDVVISGQEYTVDQREKGRGEISLKPGLYVKSGRKVLVR